MFFNRWIFTLFSWLLALPSVRLFISCFLFGFWYLLFWWNRVRRVEMATCTRDHVPHYMTHETILTMPLPHLWIQTSRFHCSNVTEIGTLPYTDTTTMYACICTVSLPIRWSSARHAVHSVPSVPVCGCIRVRVYTVHMCVRVYGMHVCMHSA